MFIQYAGDAAHHLPLYSVCVCVCTVCMCVWESGVDFFSPNCTYSIYWSRNSEIQRCYWKCTQKLFLLTSLQKVLWMSPNLPWNLCDRIVLLRVFHHLCHCALHLLICSANVNYQKIRFVVSFWVFTTIFKNMHYVSTVCVAVPCKAFVQKHPCECDHYLVC